MDAHIFVIGFVQGVGYRAFVKRNARKLELKGWVKNLSDGRVEAVVRGPKEKIEDLIKIMEKGPFLSEVKSLDVNWENNQDSFLDFQILH